jgi:type II secretory pathway pseudopilin PulG
MRAQRDLGETLIEILLTVLISGLTITALVSSLATAGRAGNVQRSSVQGDIVMRNYAEATKLAVKTCVVGASYTVVFTAPDGFKATSLPTTLTCPVVATPRVVELKVTGPLGLEEKMSIRVRTP